MATKEPDFVLVKRDLRYGRIPELVKQVTGFRESEEWIELEQNDLDELPGVVLGALRRYLLRLAKEGKANSGLVGGFDFIERLAASDDSELRNAVVTEVFEPLEPGTDRTRGFRAQLGPCSSELYREYCNVP